MELRKRGHDVFVVDLLNHQLSNYKRCDVRNYRQLERIFEKEGHFDVVYHLAAEYGRWNGEEYYENLWETNVIGTKNIIDLSIKYKVKKYLHISTDEVYGERINNRFQEEDPLRPNNPYSVTKAIAELVVQSAIESRKFPAIVIRPTNTYGPWQYPEKLIPVVILKAINPPSMSDFDSLISEARRQARNAGMKRSDIKTAITKARRKN